MFVYCPCKTQNLKLHSVTTAAFAGGHFLDGPHGHFCMDQRRNISFEHGGAGDHCLLRLLHWWFLLHPAEAMGR